MKQANKQANWTKQQYVNTVSWQKMNHQNLNRQNRERQNLDKT